MKEYLKDLTAFLARSGESDFNAEQKLDLLTQAVSNLIDEVLILRAVLTESAGISESQWRNSYREMKLRMLFSREGDSPLPVFKYQRFLMDPHPDYSGVALMI